MSDEPKDLEGVSPADVEAVTEKLKEWIPSLPEQEQLVLGWILTRAAAADDEAAVKYAQEVGAGVPASSLMAEAAGLQEVTGYQYTRIGEGAPVKVWAYAGGPLPPPIGF